MRDIVMILLILILIALLCIYLHISLSWHSIDIISLDAEEFIRKEFDPAFDTERFRIYINKLLKRIDFLDENSVIFFTPFYDRKKSQSSLNAHTGLPGQKVIIFTPGWRPDCIGSHLQKKATVRSLISLRLFSGMK